VRRVFADTGYWLALVNPNDDLHQNALNTSRSLGPVLTVTSEPVLTELLNDFGQRGPELRKAAAGLIEQLKKNPNCEVVPWTAHLFHAGFLLYKQRRDKDWSLTDCTSFVIMHERNIAESLAHDKHFEQAGYKALLR
jgi:predicted nucleic acid-binding protein